MNWGLAHGFPRVKVKGYIGQGQRSHWPKSNKTSKQRQVGSHQRQVASLLNSFKMVGNFVTKEIEYV